VHKMKSFIRYFLKHYGIITLILMLPLITANFLREIIFAKKSA
jgi:hypothetical protein